LRDTDDPVEREGIARARARAEAADLVLHVTEHLPDTPPDSGWTVLNKTDLTPPPARLPHHSFAVSALTGEGISGLREALTAWATAVTRPGEPALLGHARHRAAFADAAAAIAEAAASEDPVLRAESLRRAAHAFGRIAGRVDVDDVLDRIFSRFCIGK
jgi:tRNA modification GTPase